MPISNTLEFTSANKTKQANKKNLKVLPLWPLTESETKISLKSESYIVIVLQL